MPHLPSPGFLQTALIFLAVISVLVFVHEYGHFKVARLLGIRVDTFSVGFGREIIGRTDRHGTRWKLGWLPLGGYAKFAGDADGSSRPDASAASLPPEERANLFQFRPLWQRAAVVAAGPGINFAFAIILFALFFLIYGQQVTPPVIGQVAPDSPAAAAGLKAGDRFQTVDGQQIERYEDLMRIVAINPGTPIEVVVDRGGRTVTTELTPKLIRETDASGNEYKRGLMGVVSTSNYEIVRHGPVSALWQGVVETWNTTRMIADTLWQLVAGRRTMDELGGPLKIAQFSGQTATLGLAAMVTFVALISINLGFINLLPIPMLDGGHLFLYALEAVRRRPLEPKVQEWAFMSGFALLMSLMLFLTWNDLRSFGLWEHLAGLNG